MPKIDFSNFPYHPDLCCSEGEHMGYRRLSSEDKDALLPIFELGQRRHEPDLELALEEVRVSAENRPFILDLNKQPSPPPFEQKDPDARKADAARIRQQREEADRYNDALSKLLTATEGFKAWREVVAKFPNCVPVLQYEDADNDGAEIIRQGELLGRGGNSIAIRISEGAGDSIFSTIGALYYKLVSPTKLLVIVDCGAGRVRLAQRQQFAANTLTSILQQVPVAQQSLVRIVCVSSSFPAQAKDHLTPYEGREWEIWGAAREIAPVMFGDYGATHRLRKPNTYVPADWRATVVHPLDDGWLIYRDPSANRAEGWCEGSQRILSHDEYEPESGARGTEVMLRASRGDVKGVDSARYWHAVKVNLHLHRQLRTATERLAAFGSGDE